MRAGYLFDVGGTDWHLLETRALDGGPSATLAGPYVRLLIGFGSTTF